MDGYDLTSDVRGNRRRPNSDHHDYSRTAEKHRSMAFELGVNEYLGKPYQKTSC